MARCGVAEPGDVLYLYNFVWVDYRISNIGHPCRSREHFLYTDALYLVCLDPSKAKYASIEPLRMYWRWVEYDGWRALGWLHYEVMLFWKVTRISDYQDPANGAGRVTSRPLDQCAVVLSFKQLSLSSPQKHPVPVPIHYTSYKEAPVPSLSPCSKSPQYRQFTSCISCTAIFDTRTPG